MSSLLDSHLEQIATCAQSISELPFPGPRAFTNAILSTPDITRLIRDTEAHERALYQLAPPDTHLEGLLDSHIPTQPSTKARRTTVHSSRQPRSRVVATVLGDQLYSRLQQQSRSDVDLSLLLHGAKKLAQIHPVPGVLERISGLQQRAQQLETNIAYYEARLAEQKTEMERMHNPVGVPDHSVDEVEDTLRDKLTLLQTGAPADDPAAINNDIQQLEERKKALEDRVSGMDRDLNALAR